MELWHYIWAKSAQELSWCRFLAPRAKAVLQSYNKVDGYMFLNRKTLNKALFSESRIKGREGGNTAERENVEELLTVWSAGVSFSPWMPTKPRPQPTNQQWEYFWNIFWYSCSVHTVGCHHVTTCGSWDLTSRILGEMVFSSCIYGTNWYFFNISSYWLNSL